MNSNRRPYSSSNQHYIESGITIMHQASLEAWVEAATLVRSGKLNDGPSPWEKQNPVPDSFRWSGSLSWSMMMIHLNVIVMPAMGRQGKSKWRLGGFHFISMPSIGWFWHKRIKEDQTEFSTIKLHGDIVVSNVTSCISRESWVPALVFCLQ